MKTILKGFIVVLMLISTALPDALSLGKVPKGKTIDLESFELVWSDEFEGDTLDKSKWTYIWWETERKGGYWQEDMVEVKDGNLVITADYCDQAKENYHYDKWKDQINFKEYKPGWYTGAISSVNIYEQKYGYFEVRCKIPAAYGLWSAFWMMNDKVEDVDGSGQDGTEVDIFESFYY